jgi:hypothetical protein
LSARIVIPKVGLVGFAFDFGDAGFVAGEVKDAPGALRGAGSVR